MVLISLLSCATTYGSLHNLIDSPHRYFKIPSLSGLSIDIFYKTEEGQTCLTFERPFSLLNDQRMGSKAYFKYGGKQTNKQTTNNQTKPHIPGRK